MPADIYTAFQKPYEVKCIDASQLSDLHHLLAYKINPRLVELYRTYYRPNLEERRSRRLIEWLNEYEGARIEVVHRGFNETFEERVIDVLFILRDHVAKGNIDIDAFREHVAHIATLAFYHNSPIYLKIQELLSLIGCTYTPKFTERSDYMATYYETISRVLDDLRFSEYVTITIKVLVSGSPLIKHPIKIINRIPGQVDVKIYETSVITREDGTIVIPARKFSELVVIIDKDNVFTISVEDRPTLREINVEAIKKCLNIEGEHKDRVFQDLLRRFMIDASSISSIDSMLIKLSGLVFHVKDKFSYDRELSERYAKKIFECYEVANILLPLVDYIDHIRSIILSDPRFSNLRPYLDDLSNLMRKAAHLKHSSEEHAGINYKSMWKRIPETSPRPTLYRGVPHTDEKMRWAAEDMGERRKTYISRTRDLDSGHAISNKKRLIPSIKYLSPHIALRLIGAIVLVLNFSTFAFVPWIFYTIEYIRPTSPEAISIVSIFNYTSITRIPATMEKTTKNITQTGWDLWYTLFELARRRGESYPLFLIYLGGLLLSLIAFFARSTALGVLSSIVMGIGLYDLYHRVEEMRASFQLLHTIVAMLTGTVVNIVSFRFDVGIVLAIVGIILQIIVSAFYALER